MVSDFGETRYCKECGGEIVRDGDCITMYPGKKICRRKEGQRNCSENKTYDELEME
jgi:hypothetical protein